MQKIFNTSESFDLTVKEVNPHIAEMMLKKNSNNRKLKEATVLLYARQMKEGRWKFQGDPIRFDVNGELIDGQHRLEAIRKSGTSQKIVIIAGLSPEAKDNIDTSRARKANDVLQMNGFTHATNLAAVIRKIIAFKNGQIGIMTGGASNETGYGDGQIITNATILEFAKKDKTVTQSIEFASVVYKKWPAIPLSYMAFYHYIFSEIDEHDAFDFLTKLHSGVGINHESPIAILKSKLEQNYLAASHKKYPVRIVNGWVFYIWNKWRKGETIKLIPHIDPKKEVELI